MKVWTKMNWEDSILVRKQLSSHKAQIYLKFSQKLLIEEKICT